MRIDYLSSDILQFRGDSLAAVATAFIDGERVLLVDALASRYDAIEMHEYLVNTLRKRVERIVLLRTGTHDAALPLFPGAAVGVSAGRLRWGRHALDIVALDNGSFVIDVEGDDMLVVGDAVVGNIAPLGCGLPRDADATLASLEARARRQIVPRALGAACSQSLSNARRYLALLEQQVLALRGSLPPQEAAGAIRRIALEQCMAQGEHPGALERHWHRDNLRQIVERGLFPASAPVALRRGPVQACRETIVSVMTAMLSGLSQRV